MKKLLIIGARGAGREIADLATTCVGYGSEFVVKGFLDDKKDALVGYGKYPPLFGTVEDYKFSEEEVFIVALGDPVAKHRYAELALVNGGQPYSLVHKTAVIGVNSVIGDGCFVSFNARISVNCSIGDFSSINSFCALGHDTIVGKYCHIGAYGFTGGYSQIGDFATLHPRASLLPHKRVGDYSIVGAGSVCIKNVKPNTTVFGVPAKEL